MEERQAVQRKARGALLAKADARALEELSKKPQLLESAELKPKNPIIGGGEAGLKRVIGAGRKKVAPATAAAATLEQTADDLHAHAKQQGRTLAEYIRKLRGGAYLQHFAEALRDYKGGCECGSGSPAAVRRKGKGVEARPVNVEIINNAVPTQSAPEESATKNKRVVKPNDKRRIRGALMSKLMKEKGMSFAEASRHIKANGLV